MAVMLARFKVEDYDKWRGAFEAGMEMRKAAGCTGTHIFRNAFDPADVTINFQWDSAENAQKFFATAEFAAALERAGVIGHPDSWFVEDGGRTPN
jgi:quinol monooxygenase YgiN